MPSSSGDDPAQGGPQRPSALPSLIDTRPAKDACGIGLIADLQGPRSRKVLDLALEALHRLAHRGALGADGLTGDGTGILTEIPWRLLRDEFPDLPGPADRSLALGTFFLPRARAATKPGIQLIEGELRRSSLELLHWRRVPVEPRLLGPLGLEGLPAIYQAIVAAPAALSGVELERRLYLARRRIEKVAAARDFTLSVVSLSASTTVYKGMVPRRRLADFFPDLRHPLYETRAALFHQRFSTNTTPSWRLAQPFRLLAHNGEINTLSGNAYWMRARERELESPELGADLPELLPILDESASDSAMLDQTFELLVRAGRSPEHALAMMMPEAPTAQRGEDRRAFFDYHATLLEPWDGPAAVVYFVGSRVGAILDRNGLRPQRFWRTRDGLLILGSETGLADLGDDKVVERGRLGPGEQLVADIDSGRLWRDNEIKTRLAAQRPWRQWLAEDVVELGSVDSPAAEPLPPAELAQLQKAFGYSVELVERILDPMLREGKPPIGSMGNDAPMAVLSDQPQLPYSYFKQRFAQVTNPPLDALRERGAFSLDTYAGGWGNLLAERPPARLLRLPGPLLSADQFARLIQGEETGLQVERLDARFPAAAGLAGLEPALLALAAEAEAAARRGAGLLVLSDRHLDVIHAPIPMLLAVGAVHQHLLRQGLRMKVSLVCETGEPREDHHVACLLGFGATLVYPWLTLETVAQRAAALGLSREEALAGYHEALESGLLKVLSRLGVCPLASYHGAQLFEILGLGPAVVDRCFTGCRSRIGGVSFEHLAASPLRWHAEAFGAEVATEGLADRGYFRFRKGGERHAYSPTVFKALHRAVRSGDTEAWAEFRQEVDRIEPLHLRDLLRFRRPESLRELAEVEPAEELCHRFVGAAMSHGALSREAHETMAIAFNRLGARSNSGEGGEDPRRSLPFEGGTPSGWLAPFVPRAGDSARSRIKQVASGRFGVTASYLVDADELEIKIAQGSKPGEGGQIPGNKVTAEIAALRRAVPGRPLISPPPHHDIYSIEDLAQLIYDLRRINPRARIGVKLVALGGVGTIASGVAKAGADYIHISGDDGGTGASPLASIKHVGLPWELGLAETHQTLCRAGLRDRVKLRTDGGLKTGRDVVVAALLGADEFGFGTAPLIALGCVMARQCHLDTCPVGIATQKPELRRRFPGQPEQAMAFLLFVAEEARRLLADLGLRSLAEAVGRVDLLEEREELCRERGLNLAHLLAAQTRLPAAPSRPEKKDTEDLLLRRLQEKAGIDSTHTATLTTADRTFGARLSAALLAGKLLPGPHLIELTGCAGQSFGAFLAAGFELRLQGEAQDHVGKGLSGGTLVLRPPGRLAPSEVIAGNTLLYGATAGELYAAGRVGERFAVRNSGARAVVEGCGDHGCEYMTAGAILVLGPVGANFGAGMTGGKAWALDPDGELEARCNAESVVVEAIGREDLDEVAALLRRHAQKTGSAKAWALLAAWPVHSGKLRRIRPRCEEATREPVPARL